MAAVAVECDGHSLSPIPCLIKCRQMPVTDSFIAFVAEQLDGVGVITPKRMFGGVGIYANDIFFAILDNDRLFLKVDDSNRAHFISAGKGPFEPYGPGGETMQYYEVPIVVLEDADELARWAAKAIAAAIARKAQKKTRSGNAKAAKKIKIDKRKATTKITKKTRKD